MLRQERDGRHGGGGGGHGGGGGGHGTRKGCHYHDTAWQGDTFVVRCHSLPALKVGLASLNEGLDTFFHILALHNRLQIRQKLSYCSLFTFSNG